MPNCALSEEAFANIHPKCYLTLAIKIIENISIILLSKVKISFNISIIDNNQTEVHQFISSLIAKENLDLLEKSLTHITNSHYFLKVLVFPALLQRTAYTFTIITGLTDSIYRTSPYQPLPWQTPAHSFPMV